MDNQEKLTNQQEQIKTICRVCGRRMTEEEQPYARAFQIKLDDGDVMLHTGHETCILELHKLLVKLNYDRKMRELEEKGQQDRQEEIEQSIWGKGEKG